MFHTHTQTSLAVFPLREKKRRKERRERRRDREEERKETNKRIYFHKMFIV